MGLWLILHPWTLYAFGLFVVLAMDFIMLPFKSWDTEMRVDITLRLVCMLFGYLAYVMGFGQLAGRSWGGTALAALIVTCTLCLLNSV